MLYSLKLYKYNLARAMTKKETPTTAVQQVLQFTEYQKPAFDYCTHQLAKKKHVKN